MRDSTTCTACSVVYLIQCRRRNCQYVGGTEQVLNELMNSYWGNMKHWRTEKLVAAHFISPIHTTNDLQVLVMKEDTVMSKINESHWITILDTSWPHTMNLMIDSLWHPIHNALLNNLPSSVTYSHKHHPTSLLILLAPCTIYFCTPEEGHRPKHFVFLCWCKYILAWSTRSIQDNSDQGRHIRNKEKQGQWSKEVLSS